MTSNIKIYRSAVELPSHWDEITECYFQKKIYLHHLEKYNPRKQRYYLLYKDEKPVSGAIVFNSFVNLLTFVNLYFPVKMNVVGIPSSTVADSGLFGNSDFYNELLRFIFKNEKGFTILLNIDQHININNAVGLRGLPSIRIQREFKDYKDYCDSLRSSYRRRLKKTLDNFKDVDESVSECRSFTKEHYKLYLNVFKRSRTKLEKLKMDYFTNLPPEFKLTTYKHSNKIITWHINLKDSKRMYFLIGGIDYQINQDKDAYFNNLIGVVKESIEENCKEIEFGQTAEIPKMRVGGNLIDKYMFMYHKNPVIKGFFKVFGRYVENKPVSEIPNVFKKS
jgi:hypothetical protein